LIHEIAARMDVSLLRMALKIKSLSFVKTDPCMQDRRHRFHWEGLPQNALLNRPVAEFPASIEKTKGFQEDNQ
jgi:hypothetical protein